MKSNFPTSRHIFVVLALVTNIILFSTVALASAPACGVIRIPSMIRSGRTFATPIAATDGKTLRFWVDTAGSGFLIDATAEHYGTLTDRSSASARATLPSLAAQTAIPPLTPQGATLPVVRKADVARDPIFTGLDGQLGASWLQRRVWTFDYPQGRLLWRCNATEPTHQAIDEFRFAFDVHQRGNLRGGVEYPIAQVIVDGQQFSAALDSAASVALSPLGVRALGGSADSVRATSFAKHSVVASWHARHPAWTYVRNVGTSSDITAILVPVVSVASIRFTNVWFTTRPSDDVFDPGPIVLKLGPSAFGNDILTIDYPRKKAIVQRSP